MVWGCIAYGKRGPLIRLPPGRQKATDYVELVLAGPLMDFYVEMKEEMEDVRVMEDGAPVHRAKVSQAFRKNNSMTVMPHPPQSPDLNPIEHIWKQLKVLVNQRHTRPQNLDQLWIALQEEWLNISIDFINSLIDSMPRRALAVHSAKGKATKY